MVGCSCIFFLGILEGKKWSCRQSESLEYYQKLGKETETPVSIRRL